jgi:hypothetical protein
MKRTLAAGLLLVISSGSVLAQESVDVHPSLDSKFYLDLGMYYPTRKLTIPVHGTAGGENDSMDFDRGNHANQSDNTDAGEFGWRFGEKWSFRTQFFANSPSRTATLDEDIEWKDIVFGEGSAVTLGSDFKLVRLFFGRTFETSERHDVGIGAGLHWLEMGAFIKGEAIVNGMPVGIRRESVSVAAPLPNIGAWYSYSISPRWAAHGRVDWFSAGIDEYDGRLLNGSVGVEYKIFEHGGLGVSYNVVDLNLDIDKSNWTGSIGTRYSGLYASVNFYW